MFHEILRKNGAPEDLIQFVEEPSTDLSAELMASCDAVVATGGMASLMASGTDCIDHVDKLLTLTGLQLIYEKNKPAHPKRAKQNADA